MDAGRSDHPGLNEVIAVWALFALTALAVVVTYARLPPAALYNTSEEGLAGGLGRALVFVNFPVALAAIPLAGLAAERLRSRAGDLVALAAVALCLVVGLPGIVEQDDLDAKPANAIPALGVALALALAVRALVRRGRGELLRPVRGDLLRVVLAVVLVLGSIPWIAAELGFYVTGAPGLRSVFLAGEIVPEPGHPELRAVHLGRHHGTDGVLLALTALLLTRELGRVVRPRLRLALAAYLSLLLVYGLANAVQDFWLEQLYKRGTTGFRFPDMLRPGLGPEWLGMLLAAGAVYAALALTSRQARRRPL